MRALSAVMLRSSLGVALFAAAPLAAQPLAHHASLARLRDDDGRLRGRVLVQSASPIQLPRIVAARDGWAMTWSAYHPQALEVSLAMLDDRLAETGRVQVTPDDNVPSGYAFASFNGAAWGVVFDDGHRDRTAWFARVDGHSRVATSPAAFTTTTQQPTLVWNPATEQWGVLTHAAGKMWFQTVSGGGVVSPAVSLGDGNYFTEGASPLIHCRGAWAFLYVEYRQLILTTFTDPARRTYLPVRGGGAFNGAALDCDADGFGMAWSDLFDGIFSTQLAGRRFAPTHRLSDARGASQPSLAWNGREHVVAWSERPEGVSSVRVARIGVDGTPSAAQTVMRGVQGAEALWPHLSAGGADGRAVALTWQVGQGTAMGLVLDW